MRPGVPHRVANKSQQPATSNEQPTAINQQPAASNEQPATSNQQPTGSPNRPGGMREAIEFPPPPVGDREQGVFKILTQDPARSCQDRQVQAPSAPAHSAGPCIPVAVFDPKSIDFCSTSQLILHISTFEPCAKSPKSSFFALRIS